MSKQDKMITKEKAFMRMAGICSRKECCSFDIHQKLYKMDLSQQAVDEIIRCLKNENYINDERFVRSFINDKIEINRWGKKKIELFLKQKQLPTAIVEKVFSEYTDSELNKYLMSELKKKWRYIKGDTEYEKKAKLINYALGRGFELKDITSSVREIKLSEIDKEAYGVDL